MSKYHPVLTREVSQAMHSHLGRRDDYVECVHDHSPDPNCMWQQELELRNIQIIYLVLFLRNLAFI